MPIHLHIEHLILEDAPFPGSDSRTFRAALERELSAQSAGIPSSQWASAHCTSVTAREISPNPSASLQSWAEASARSLLAAVTSATR